MRRCGLVLAVVCVLGGMVATGWAADQLPAAKRPTVQAGCPGRFAALDADHNGIVIPREFVAGATNQMDAMKMFQVRDRNGDGMLTVDEFCPRNGSFATARFSLMDTDHDGVVSKKEFMRMHRPGPRTEAQFKALDVNADGKLSLTEFSAR